MPDSFTEVTKTGLGKKLSNSCIGVFVGIILFFGSFILLYWNEGRIDLSIIANAAIILDADKPNSDAALNGKLVSVTGKFGTTEKIGDNLFLKPDTYVYAERIVEMYAWDQESESTEKDNLGGSTTTTTTYNYVKEWAQNPTDSKFFKHPEGHENPVKDIENVLLKPQTAQIGVYNVVPANAKYAMETAGVLSQKQVLLKNNATLEGQYIFISKTAGSSLSSPAIGDLRVSYRLWSSGLSATVFGDLDGKNISAHLAPKNTTLYHIFYGDRATAIQTLHTDYVNKLWIFRLLGLLAMWIGLGNVFGPIVTLLHILPTIGNISKRFFSFITFVAAFVLSLLTIGISMILHNPIAIVIALVFAAIVIAIVVVITKKHTQSKT